MGFVGPRLCKKLFQTFQKYKKYTKYIFISHNARGFHRRLLLNYLVSTTEDQTFGQIFEDSLSFLTLRLSQMPKALGFD